MSVFSDEWRRCMREQYKYVARTGDEVTRPTLTHVMQKVGFGEDELRQLYIEATMRQDDNADDFVPPADIIEPNAAPEPVSNAHPAECQCPSCIQLDVVPHDADGQPIPPEQRDDEEAPDDDAPNQLSLF